MSKTDPSGSNETSKETKQREIGLETSPLTSDTADTELSSGEKTVDFESSLEQLETIVSKMESGDLSLEASLQEFQKGIELTRACQSALQDAELRVKVVMEGADGSLERRDLDA